MYVVNAFTTIYPPPPPALFTARLDFYQRAKSVYAVIHTLDDVPYGCFILQKGVIFK